MCFKISSNQIYYNQRKEPLVLNPFAILEPQVEGLINEPYSDACSHPSMDSLLINPSRPVRFRKLYWNKN